MSSGVGSLWSLKEYDLYIPTYQRGYAWKKENVRDFIIDLTEAVKANNRDHYYGTIFIGTRTGGDGEIIDGQQRITTAFLCFKCLLDKMEQIGVKDTLRDDIKKILYNEKEIRLKSNNVNRELFTKIMIEGGKQKNRRHDDDPYNKNLINAYQTLNRKIEKMEKEDVMKWGHKLRDFKVIIIEENRRDAHAMFDLINSRGVQLKQFELIKNHLFSLADSENEDEKWTRTYELVTGSGGDLDKFITHVMNLDDSITKFVTERRTSEEIKKNVDWDVAKAKKWLTTFEDYAKLYYALRKPAKKQFNNKSRIYLELINKIDGELIYRPLLAGCKLYFDDKDQHKNNFEKILPLCLKYHLGVKTLANGRADDLRPLTDIAQNCFKDKIDIEAIKTKLTFTSRQEADIKSGIKDISYEFKKSNSTLTVLLFLLEEGQESFVNSNFTNAEIDHILPQNNTSNVDEQHLHGLGNLTLLEENKNGGLKDAPYDNQKKKKYLSSGYTETQQIPSQYARWGIKQIDKRTKYMTTKISKSILGK